MTVDSSSSKTTKIPTVIQITSIQVKGTSKLMRGLQPDLGPTKPEEPPGCRFSVNNWGFCWVGLSV